MSPTEAMVGSPRKTRTLEQPVHAMKARCEGWGDRTTSSAVVGLRWRSTNDTSEAPATFALMARGPIDRLAGGRTGSTAHCRRGGKTQAWSSLIPAGVCVRLG